MLILILPVHQWINWLAINNLTRPMRLLNWMNHHQHRLPLEEFYLNEYLYPIEYWLFLVKVLQLDKSDYLPFLDLEFLGLKQFDYLLHGY